MKKTLLAIAACFAAVAAFAQPQLREDNIDEVLKAMTLQEKATLLVGGARAVIVDGIPLQYGNFDGKMFARRTVTLTAQSSKYGITGWNVIQTDANGHTTQTQISGTDYEFTMPSSGSIAINAMITSDILLGDINSDGIVSIDDVTALIDLLLGGHDVDNIDAADVNGDNNIGIDDVTALIDLLLSGL